MNIQDNYFSIINKIGEEEAEKLVVSKLRQLADHIESGRYPKIYGVNLIEEDPPYKNNLMYKLEIVLSHIWPG